MATKEIVDNFVSNVDINNTYTTPELVALLKTSIKATSKSGGKSRSKSKNSTVEGGEVKAPKALSAYNLFIREKMKELKDKDMTPKDRLIAATTAWNLEKAQKLANKSSTPVANDEE
jgi:hypothetical protein